MRMLRTDWVSRVREWCILLVLFGGRTVVMMRRLRRMLMVFIGLRTRLFRRWCRRMSTLRRDCGGRLVVRRLIGLSFVRRLVVAVTFIFVLFRGL